MSLAHGFLVNLFRVVCSLIFRIDADQLEGVPERGPLIIVTNHINVWEVPIIYWRLQPRRVHGMVLAKRWENPIVGWGLNVCGSIPVERGGINLEAMRRGLEALTKGEILLIMPEGTRSGDGKLQTGHPGILPLALKSGAPILPVAFYGSEKYRENLKRFRRTDFHVAVGTPFYLNPDGEAASHESRQQMVDEIMCQLAALLPPAYRGHYADMPPATNRYLTPAPP